MISDTSFEVVKWPDSLLSIDEKNGKLHLYIEYNHASVYLLEDSTYLVIPLNHFGNAIKTSNRALIDDWIEQRRFPSEDTESASYIDGTYDFSNFQESKNSLISDLFTLPFFSEKGSPSKVDIAIIDELYAYLKKKRKFKKYKINFLLWAGDFLIRQSSEPIEWGVLSTTQLLNPVNDLVLITKGNRYYNLEFKMHGKYGYVGMLYYQKTISFKRVSEFETLVSLGN